MRWFEFQNKIEMKSFAYRDADGLNEELVKGVIGLFLELDRYDVDVGKKRERGADIRAAKKGVRLIIEAKGEGSRDEMFNNFFLNALGEILQRMSEPAAEYGIALPAHRKFARLVEELPDTVRNILRLNFYLVKNSREHNYEVGILKWNTR